MSVEYAVTLGPAAERLIRSLANPVPLVDSLATELEKGPNADNEVRYDRNIELCPGTSAPSGVIYTATPLSIGAYTAIHRPMTDGELVRLEKEQGRPVADHGFFVIDILPPELGFTRRSRTLGWRSPGR